MPKAKFNDIYEDLKEKIETNAYPYQSLLPSEHELTERYSCSRNTIRRALRGLIERGYAQAIQGKGVRVLYQTPKQSTFRIGGIETFQESAARNHLNAETRVIHFDTVCCNERLSAQTGFPVGEMLFDIRRVRYLDGKPLILDKNLFRADLVPNLTPEIASHSIYAYIENTLGMTIVTSKRRMTVERATKEDEALLDLGGYNCLAVITSQAFNDNGIQIEYTVSRHHPERFCFEDTATRQRTTAR